MSSLTSRRRNTPWIHRWSRPLIGAIALLGIANTAYLTINKLAKTTAVCPTSGCERVLDSPYATVFGLPLSLFGLLAYIAMATFALAPLLINSEKNRPLRGSLEKTTWWLLFFGATAMTVFSAYLMYIMVSQFVAQFGVGGICYYCIGSAVFALSLLVLTLIGRDWDDAGQLLFTGTIVAVITLVGTLAIYAPLNVQSEQVVNGKLGAPITTTSGPAEIALATHLKQTGAKMYGAYWCPHCHDQKQLFGQAAAKIFPYVECAADGNNSEPALCEQVVAKAQIQTGQPFGFPTWEINGKFFPGTKSLTELARLSSYTGAQNFQNGS